MSLLSAFAIYFIIWWISLFAVLPFGVRTQAEAGEVVPGAPASAPARFRIAVVILRTSLIAALIFAVVLYIVDYSGLTLDDIPF